MWFHPVAKLLEPRSHPHPGIGIKKRFWPATINMQGASGRPIFLAQCIALLEAVFRTIVNRWRCGLLAIS